MKNGIHPQFHTNAKVTCACGHSFVTGSIMPTLYTEICSNCHPFFTGKQNFIDTAGRVDKFKQRIQAASEKQAVKKEKKPRKTRVEV